MTRSLINSTLDKQTVDDQIRLLAFQQTLDQETGTMSTERSYVGMSVSETIRTCIIAGLEKKAEKIRSDWKVSDKRFVFLIRRFQDTSSY
jgi:hypothetical protein